MRILVCLICALAVATAAPSETPREVPTAVSTVVQEDEAQLAASPAPPPADAAGTTATAKDQAPRKDEAGPPSSSPPLENGGASPDVSILTLPEAIALALTQNDRLINMLDSVEQAQLSLRLARSNFRPKIVPNILGSFGQSDVSNQTYRVDVSQRFVTGTELRAGVGASTERNQLGTYYSTDTTLSLSQPLLRGFGRSVSRRALSSAEARALDIVREQRMSEQQVAVEVAAAYYRIVSQKMMVDVAQKTAERSRTLLGASEAKLEVGKVSQLDVFRARQLVAQADGQLLDAQAAVEEAMDQLRYLLGRGPEFLFDVKSDIPTGVETVTVEQAVETALAHRLELANAQHALAEASRLVAYNRNQLLPQLDLNLALTRRDVADSLRTAFKFDKLDFASFFTISMPVDRTPQTIEYHNALIERDRRRREINLLKMRIVESVRRAVRQQARVRQTLAVSEEAVEFAGKEVEVAALRYQRGLSNNLDVVNAEESWLSARSRRVSLLVELAIARLQLRVAMGILDPRQDFLPPTP
jgi:outer membrane protein